MKRPRRVVHPWRRLGAALLAAGVASCASQPFRGDSGIRPFSFDLWDIRCPSGLRVIFERAPGGGRAGVTTYVGAGATQDPPGREGLAHLVEHLTFRGTHGPGQAPVRLQLDALGANQNAFTSHDETHYFAFVPPQSLHDVLALEGQVFAAPLEGLDERTFAVERDVVRNELREHYETETSRASYNAARAAVYPAGHPYARPAIGTHASLSAITLDDARRFVAANYRPEAMTMVVVGDMDPAASEAFVRAALPPALYGDPSHARPHLPPPAPATGPPPLSPPGQLARAHAQVPSPELLIAWTTPAGFGPSRYLAQAWTWIAGGNFYRGQFDDSDISSVELNAVPGLLSSMFVCHVHLARGDHPERSLKEVVDALPWIGGDEVYLDRRMEQIKLGLLRDLSFDAESARTRSDVRAAYAHFQGSPSAYGAIVDTIKSITADGARDFAAQYLGRDRARAVLVTPFADDAPPPAPVPAAQDLTAIAAHTPLTPQALGNLTRLRHLDGLKTVTFSNGLQAIFLRRPGAPVITVTLALHGGQSAAGVGVAAAAHETFSPNWRESPGDFGIWYQFRTTSDLSTAVIRAGADNLPRALDMLSFATRSYDVDWPSDKFQAATLPLLRRRDAFATNLAERALWTQLLEGHVYGDQPLADQIASVKKADITAWFDRTFAPANGALVVVGDIDVGQAEAEARDAFEGWHEAAGAVPPPAPATPRAATPPSAALPGGTSVLVQHRPGATQAELHMACVLPPADARRDAVYDVAAALVENALSSQLRENAGSTYDVSATGSTLRGGTAMLRIGTDVDNGQLPLVLATVRGFWGRVLKEGIGKEDVRLSRDALARQRLLGFDTSASLAGALVMSWNQGWPLTWTDDTPKYFATIDEVEATAALRDCARTLILSITGDEPVIRRALRERRTPAAAAPPHAAPSPAP